MQGVMTIMTILLIGTKIGPTPINMPHVLEGETRVLEVTISHRQKMSRSRRLALNSAANRVETRVHWEGHGAGRHLTYTRIERLNNGCAAKSKFTFLPGKEFRMKNFERVLTSPTGRVLEREFHDFTDPVFKYPPVLVHPFTLELAFRSFELKPGNRRVFNLWFASTGVLTMETTVTKIEEIELPGGKRMKCYRLDMKPNFTEDFGAFVNKIISPLVPDFTFWLSAEGTHPMVKYRGPLGQVSPVGAPTETHELVSYNPGGGK